MSFIGFRIGGMMMPFHTLSFDTSAHRPTSLQSCPVDSDERGPSTLLTPLTADLVHDAYRRLTYEQLHLFCSMRSLSTEGTQVELACRLAHYDLRIYASPPASIPYHPNDNDSKPANRHFYPSPNVSSAFISQKHRVFNHLPHPPSNLSAKPRQ
jgi:hypothetical protein